MKKVFLFAIIMGALSLLLVPVPAQAGYYQATSTWDVRTPPSTPTYGTPGEFFPTMMTSTRYPCPAGTAQGWGTITPGALWSILCEDCISHSETPTVFQWPSPGGRNACELLDPEYAIDCYSCIVGLSEWDAVNHVCMVDTVTPTSGGSATPSPTVISTCFADAGMKWLSNDFVTTMDLVSNNDTEFYFDRIYSFSGTCDASSWGQFKINVQGHPIALGFEDVYYARLTTVSSTNWYHDLYAGEHVLMEGVISDGLDFTDQGLMFYGHGIVAGACGGTFHWEAGRNVNQFSELCLGSVTATPNWTPTLGSAYCDTVSTDQIDPSDMAFWHIEGPPVCVTTPYISAEDMLLAIIDYSGWIPIIGGLIAKFILIITDVTPLVSLPAQTICMQGYAFDNPVVFGISITIVIFFAAIVVGFLLNTLRKK